MQLTALPMAVQATTDGRLARGSGVAQRVCVDAGDAPPLPWELVIKLDVQVHIHGSICALATPFDEQGDLDLEAFERLIEQQLAGGTQALVVAGSTGEAHLLRDHEYERLLQCAVARVDGRVPVIAGCGSASTEASLAGCRKAASLGADAALVVTPYYVRPDQRGLQRHFTALAHAVELPLILYNVPARTGCDLQPETVAALREHPRIIGIKEAVADRVRIEAMARLARGDFVYLSGDDGSAMEAMLAGAAGTVSVVANVVPRLFRELCDACRNGERGSAGEAFERLRPLLDALACAPNPVPIKAALAALQICREQVRLPLVPLPEGEGRVRLQRIVTDLAGNPD